MDQSLVHTFSWGNSYGPMVLKVLLKFPPTLVLVHGWVFPVSDQLTMTFASRIRVCPLLQAALDLFGVVLLMRSSVER